MENGSDSNTINVLVNSDPTCMHKTAKGREEKEVYIKYQKQL